MSKRRELERRAKRRIANVAASLTPEQLEAWLNQLEAEHGTPPAQV